MKSFAHCTALLVVIAALTGCRTRASLSSTPLQEENAAQSFALHPHEKLETDEEAKIKTIVDLSLELMDKTTKSEGNAKVLREVHSKAHACLRGLFLVNDKLEMQNQVGVFQVEKDENSESVGKKYSAWVRFSNGAPGGSTPDTTRQTSRGLAIKLLGVPGPKLLDEELSTQDFLFVNGRRFFIRDLDSYATFLKNSNQERQLQTLVGLGPRQSLALTERFRLKIANPAQVPYFSAVPYAWGDSKMATKYRLTPCTPQPEQLVPKDAGDNHLSEALAETLKAEDICYNFELLKQRDNMRQPVEDSLVEWTAEDSDVVTVAKLIIPRGQSLEHEMCEDLSFHPWHSLAEHRPLGSMNRARRAVYSALAAARRKSNNVPAFEPQEDKAFRKLWSEHLADRR